MQKLKSLFTCFR